jgi:hypothetical protein
MAHRNRRVAAAGVVLSITAITATLSGSAAGAHHDQFHWTSVPAQVDVRGYAAPNVLSPGVFEYPVAQGSTKLENPTPEVPYYGYDGDGTLVPDPAVTPGSGANVEATKSEGDKNTYLRLHGLHGADPNYNYGSRFLYQGHENGLGYITRINLDADAAHRVTLLATKQADGTPIPTIDGSTWDPWAKRLLFTTESTSNASVMQATPDINATVEDISAVTGRGGYEGIQNDSEGNLWIVEDIGGATIPGTKVKLPNSFVYRLVPYDKDDLTKGGKLQALQVISRRTGTPITFQPIDATHPNGGALTDDQADLTNYGPSFHTTWVTIHDTKVDTSGLPFNANAAAKAAGATPFKRPENGLFRPGTGFKEFFFDATGDTNTTSAANAGFGGWGGVFKLTQSRPGADEGTLSLFYAGNQAHTGLDNNAFFDKDHIAFVEDASDTVHTQRGTFDSGYLFDVNHDYAKGGEPVRFLAEGRDASATLDNMIGGTIPGFHNDGDNEITGIHVSDGDPGTGGILGAKVPNLFHDGWRLFWNQQHGDNVAWEILPNDD